jgi:hypothetical protein
MPDPAYESRTPRFGMPLLFAGQAQKEGHVNETTSQIDALLHGAIEGEASAPPATPVEGQCWLVGASPTGDWAGHSGKIAARQSGNWLFFSPRDGMRVLDRSSDQEIRYSSGWKVASRPALPSGGTTIDTEARAAIALIVSCLTVAGLIPAA